MFASLYCICNNDKIVIYKPKVNKYCKCLLACTVSATPHIILLPSNNLEERSCVNEWQHQNRRRGRGAVCPHFGFSDGFLGRYNTCSNRGAPAWRQPFRLISFLSSSRQSTWQATRACVWLEVVLFPPSNVRPRRRLGIALCPCGAQFVTSANLLSGSTKRIFFFISVCGNVPVNTMCKHN